MKQLALVLCLVTFAPALVAQKRVPPREPNRVIYDFANILDAEGRESIQKIVWPLFQVKRPIVIVTVNRLEEYDASPEQIQEFATLIYNRWGIGSRTSGNMGALILVAKEDRRMSIVVGEGITGYRQDQCQSIIDDIMGPNFKERDFAGGLREGAIAIRDRIFQPKTSIDLSNIDLSNIPVESGAAEPPASPGGAGGIGLPGPGGAPDASSGGRPTFPAPAPDEQPRPRPRSEPQFPGGTDLNFDCGKWFCFAIGILVLISMFRRRRPPAYGYGPPPMGGQPPYMPQGYGYRNYRGGGGGFGGMLGGILTGMLLGRMGGRSSGGRSGGGGSVFGGGGGGFGGGGGSGGGGGGGGGGFGGGSSSGGGASGSW